VALQLTLAAEQLALPLHSLKPFFFFFFFSFSAAVVVVVVVQDGY
jgi:hypothetical protein